MHPRILIIEDELPMRTALMDVLAGDGYRVLTASDGEAGLERALAEKPDLILLDLMMPRLDGYSVCLQLRRLAVAVPILMLTAKGQVEDRVRGLDAGADDYLVKPFSTEELLARVRAMLQRVAHAAPPLRLLTLGAVRIDFAQQLAWRGRKPLHLTTKEFAVLRLLAEAEGQFAFWPYLHRPKSYQLWLKEFPAYAVRQANGLPLGTWVRNHYDPQAFAQFLAAKGLPRSFRAFQAEASG